ncbi:chemotaxis protein [Caballeronia sordidicola]|uniref:Chemotaxis protein n=1 Tax=Caballeronia sordidicola TaxID=196367 RepID=A0A158IG03_CABSO|nr:methyl-accepting chemotaxis protein [Caballeronia sordidicola]SAL55407.1 chemotaxis protein [Caballeronia sordidicola]
MNLRNITIRNKLIAGFGVLAVIVLGVSVFSLRALSNSTDGFSNYVHGPSARADVAAQVRTAVDRRAIAARNLVLVTKPSDLELEKAEVIRASEDVQTKLKLLKTMVANGPGSSDRARSLVGEIDRVESLYGPVANGIVALALAGKHEEAIVKMDDECRPLLAALVNASNAYAEYTRGRQEQMVRASDEQYQTQRNWLIAMCVAALALAVAAGVFITHSITGPIRRAVDVASTVARGDLRSRIAVTQKDETGQLLGALADMNARLIETVSRVRESSGSVANASTEIATGNTDLSQRTEEQAASLEQTAASMEELTSTVKQNTESAQQASVLASNASDVARRGSEVVSQVVDTMHGISTSSTKIAEITGMIEGIAFQTNILALNAAVEAARAGEQGRGFAVVASEVRSLAQRSSNAAKEIKELIANSVQQVQSGSVLAGRAGETMAEVTQAVARVTDMMEEIAAASIEQGRGIEQVNQAITQMDEVTQQNAALVEEAAAASQSLQDQGRRLMNAVAFFQMEDAPAAAAPNVRALAKAAPKRVQAARLQAAGNEGWSTF